MVNPALKANVDALDGDELDELIEYVAARRAGDVALTDSQIATLANRRSDANSANWIDDGEFDNRLNSLTS